MTYEAHMSWTDERVEQLRLHWVEGKSASQIAALLGHGLTRNAVIGKVHRLGCGDPREIAGLGQPATPARRADTMRSSFRGRARRGRSSDWTDATALAIAPQAFADADAQGLRERGRADVAQGHHR